MSPEGKMNTATSYSGIFLHHIGYIQLLPLLSDKQHSDTCCSCSFLAMADTLLLHTLYNYTHWKILFRSDMFLVNRLCSYMPQYYSGRFQFCIRCTWIGWTCQTLFGRFRYYIKNIWIGWTCQSLSDTSQWNTGCN